MSDSRTSTGRRLIQFLGLALCATQFFSLESTCLLAQELPFTQYTQESEVAPLPSADVRSIYQDRLGYVWFVIYSSGLLRYDGHAFEPYGVSDGLTEPTVRQIIEDSFGRLWVASNAGLMVSDRPLQQYGTGERIHFITHIGSVELVHSAIVENRMAVDQRGWFWVGTRENGIIRYRSNGLDSVSVDTIRTDISGAGKNRDVRSITVRKDGSVYAGIGGNEILVFKSALPSFEVLGINEGTPAGISTDVMFENRKGRLFGGCRNGIFWQLVESSTARPRIAVIDTEFHSRVSSILEESDGTLWISSSGSGAMRISNPDNLLSAPIRRALYTRRNGLLSDNINDLLIDREGNIWFAQSGGGSKLRANYAAFTNYSPVSHGGQKPLLSSGEVNSVFPLSGGGFPNSLWIGTSTGGLIILANDTTLETIRTDRGLRADWVYDVSRDPEGRVWIASQSGINCISFNPSVRPPSSPEIQPIILFGQKCSIASYRNNSVYRCLPLQMWADSTGTRTVESLWFPGFQNLYCYAENEWYVFRSTSGLPSSAFTAAAFDNRGVLWVGTRDAGLYRSTGPVTLARLRSSPMQDVDVQPGTKSGRFGGEITVPLFEPAFSKNTGLTSNQIETLLLQDSVLWAGTFDGLTAFEGQPLTPTTRLSAADGLPANNATSIALSPATGNLWIGTNGGLAEVGMKTRRLLRTVTKQDGLVDNEVWSSSSVAVGGDGTIYFGTAKGVAYYRPPLDRANDIPPIPQLHRASLVEDLSGNEILFEYAALSFSNERLVRYRTRLAGYDRDWSPENRDVKIRYTNLTTFLFPKEYSFEIRACNNSGVWTDAPLKYSFSVQPLWWFRWWAVGSYLLALGAGLFITRQLDLRRQLKKAENERRVKELEEARALQLSMLPNDIPQLPQLEIAVYMKTASEVGGDYYDFYVDPDGTLTVAIGDATGHGLNAGMVVTATKSLFRTFALQADLPAAFNHANEIFRSMNLRKLYMALAILRVKEYRAQLCAAGMPPLLIRRGTTNTVEEHLVKGMPIGSVAKFPYQILEFDLVPGDALVLMSDGLPERFNGRKEMLGYDEAKAVLEGISDNAPQAIIQRYLEVEQAWSEGQPQDDDITFIVLRVKDGKANAPADTDKNAVRQ